jgi:DNA-binding protein H-NS
MNKQEIEKVISYWSEFKAEIKDLRKQNSKVDWDEQEKAVDLAIEALGKKVPKKPVKCTTNKPVKIGNVTFSKGTSIYKCPNCGGLITYYKYCCSCGQALDWGDDNKSEVLTREKLELFKQLIFDCATNLANKYEEPKEVSNKLYDILEQMDKYKFNE